MDGRVKVYTGIVLLIVGILLTMLAFAAVGNNIIFLFGGVILFLIGIGLIIFNAKIVR